MLTPRFFLLSSLVGPLGTHDGAHDGALGSKEWSGGRDVVVLVVTVLCVSIERKKVSEGLRGRLTSGVTTSGDRCRWPG